MTTPSRPLQPSQAAPHQPSQTEQPVLRFAPSPNGYLHLGHALSALIVWRWTKALNGRFLLRIEDTDLGRSRPQFVDAIYEDLTWLGITWEEPVRIQSEHLTDYEQAITTLWDLGLLYPAPASRTEIRKAVAALDAKEAAWPRDPDGSPFYPFSDRDKAQTPDSIPPGEPLRLDVPAALAQIGSDTLTASILADPSAELEHVSLDPARWGDPLIRGRDRPVTYHLAVVLDDALQGVTHVVRGQDIEVATSLHRLLQDVLGLPAPVYHHHRLIMGEDGRKLSKSEGAKSLRELRRNGVSRDELLERLLS